jgi:hypothetical protein
MYNKYLHTKKREKTKKNFFANSLVGLLYCSWKIGAVLDEVFVFYRRIFLCRSPIVLRGFILFLTFSYWSIIQVNRLENLVTQCICLFHTSNCYHYNYNSYIIINNIIIIIIVIIVIVIIFCLRVIYTNLGMFFENLQF